MKRTDIIACEGKKVKLVLDNDYVLRGTIGQVNEDSVFFKTSGTSSIIHFDAIKSIVF